MRSAAVTALLVGSVLACGVAAGSPRAPAAHPAAAAFSYWGGPFDQVLTSSVDWGDYDGDGDLDLLLAGSVGGGQVTWVYRNDGGLSFTRLPDMFVHVSYCSAKWGDFDGDGDLDILLAGLTNGGVAVTKIYRNDGSTTFVDVGPVLPGVGAASVDWGDEDNDGDLDILLTGMLAISTPRTSRVYRNNGGGTFSNIGAGLPGVAISSASFGDYDADGDQDILLTGEQDVAGTYVSSVYRNDGGGAFVDIAATLTPVTAGTSQWGDCDSDGDLDLLITGQSATGNVAKLYRNDGGTFVEVAAPFVGVASLSSVAWGDADNDGDLDVHLDGYDNTSQYVSRLYLNDGLGGFTDSGVFLEPVAGGQAAWADADNDGDLDLIQTGVKILSVNFTALYRNDAATANTLPNPPTNLSATVGAWNGTFPVTFSWDAGSDAETVTPGLTYNLRVGHTPASNDVMPSMSSTGGYRRVVRRGNVDHNLSWTLHLPPGTYSWSVQSIDAAYAGSTFASKQTVVVAPVSVPDDTRTSTVALRAIEPNPFSAAATIEFEVAREAPVTLRVHDIGGRLVRTIIDGASWPAGRHSATWDGMDENGRPAPAGIYLATIDIGGVRDQRRVARLR